MGRMRTRRALTVGAAVLAAAAAGCGSDDDKAADKPATQAQAQPPEATATTPAPAATTPAPAASDDTAPEPSSLKTVSGTPIARAAAVAANHQGGISVAMRGTIQSKGVETTVTGKGSIDRRSQRGSFDSTTAIHGAKIDVRQILDGGAVYLTSDAFKGRLPGGKSWMKI